MLSKLGGDQVIGLCFARDRYCRIKTLDDPLPGGERALALGERLGRENHICDPGRRCLDHILYGNEACALERLG